MSEKTEAARERIEQVDMLALAGAIFAHLPGWTVEPRNPDVDDYEPPRMAYVRIQHVSGARCAISRSTWPPECHVSGYWPREGDQQTGAEYAPRQRPRASFSPFRDPKGLAKDIDRRFLAAYLPEWATQKAARDEAQLKAEEAHRLAAKLARVLGADLREHSEGWRMYSQGGDLYEVRVTRWGSVHFERFSTSRPDFALAVARLASKWRPPAPAPEPVCTGCFRPEGECSLEPCEDVRADRLARVGDGGEATAASNQRPSWAS